MRCIVSLIVACTACAAAAQSPSGAIPIGPASANRTIFEATLARMREAVQSAHKKTFQEFKADLQPGRVEVEANLWEPGTGKQLFEDVRKKLASFYAELPVLATVQVAADRDKAVLSFDCIPIAEQPSIRTLLKKVPVESPPKDPEGTKTAAINQALGAAACPLGAIAFQRHTVLETAIGSGTKTRMFSTNMRLLQQPKPLIDRAAIATMQGQKAQGVAPTAATSHRYAHALAKAANQGAASRLSVWSPVVPSGEMSISQIWVTGGGAGDRTLQTVEAGWQVYSGLWGLREPHLFVYSTSDNYGATGCYVTKCNMSNRSETFVITTNKVIIGRPIPQQSTVGGNQVVMEFKWIRKPETGSWWLKIDDEWVGYYPNAVFNDGVLSKGAELVDFGGETYGVTATSQMGSGRFSKDGKSLAAFQSRMRYLDTNGKFVPASLVPFQTAPLCYTASLNSPNPPETGVDNYLYFGGPGVANQGC